MSVHYKGVEMIRNESNANINLDELDVDTDVQEIISHTVTEELAYAAKILLDGGYGNSGNCQLAAPAVRAGEHQSGKSTSRA
jgi:hypothetical protein